MKSNGILYPPSTPFKLDLLSAGKYGTPAPGARCNDVLRCWIPSNDVTRKVTEALDSSHRSLARHPFGLSWPQGAQISRGVAVRF